VTGRFRPDLSTEVILDLLRTTTLTNHQIARRYGLTDAAIVHRVRKATGLTTIQYRRQYGWATQTMPPAVAEEVVAAYVAGATLREVAAKYHVGRRSVVKACRAAEATLRTGAPPRKECWKFAEEIVARYQAGESCPQLGQAYGVNEKLIRSVLDAAGVKRRRRGRIPASG